MNIRKAVPHVLLILGAILLLLNSYGQFDDAFTSLADKASYLEAPVLTGGDDPADFNGRLVWVRGTLVPAGPVTFMVSPYTESKCLAYDAEKLRGEWETDDDGGQSRVWAVEQRIHRTLPVNIRVGDVSLGIDAENVEFLNLIPGMDGENTVDGIPYRFSERIMPLANMVWAVGRLLDEKITPVEQKSWLSYDSPEPIARRLLRDVPLNLFFAVFLGMAGLGLLTGFIALLLRGRDVFLKPLAVAVVFTAPAYCWALAGVVSAGRSAGSPLLLLPLGIMVTIPALVPLLLHKGRPRFPSCLLFLIPVVALALGAGWFLDQALFAVSGRGWPLAAGIFLFTIAVALYFFWHFKTEPRPAK